jgi:adenosine deaminase
MAEAPLVDPAPAGFAELHVHLEGTLEPGLVRVLARRNGMSIPDGHPALNRPASGYRDLREFLDAYYGAMAVLQTEADFHDLAAGYFARAAAGGVVRAEVFFDPQAHLARGVPVDVVMGGFSAAQAEAERDLGVTSGLIACFQRGRGGDAAQETFERLLPFRDRLLGVGLVGAEVPGSTAPFARVFARAAADGLHRTAHAGQDGGPDQVAEALDLLEAERVDHGIRAMDDPDLVARLRDELVPLTVCPLSNVRLGIVASIERHPLRRMLAAGLRVSVNSDDPAYFGAYLDDNLAALRSGLAFTNDEVAALAAASRAAAFLSA